MKIAVLGAGNLGSAIIKNASRNAEVIAVRRRKELLPDIENVTAVSEFEETREANIFLVTLKPDVFRKNLERIGEIVKGKPLISFVPGIKLEDMLKYIDNPFRAMTNIGIEDGGVIACYPPETAEHLRFLEADFILCRSEEELEAMTSFIGSAPAIIAKLINAFVVSAVREGVNYEHALKASVNVFGTAGRLYEKYGFDGMLRRIATPGGTTAEGLRNVVMAEKYLMDALISASRRVEEL
ncbi:pyrroline-5-carboxylate reductase dimerization domain-containing protein [Geoglobus acetivorans]|uniref:NAD(P)-binding domain-containing protein n=1 Tax=Geoglobus acetivorans TaxID=565033 RepID=A0ABZ3GZI0_GEOAI|nr:NAD(P)-binding domain-containing protein [Geoglobus acetivorans]